MIKVGNLKVYLEFILHFFK